MGEQKLPNFFCSTRFMMAVIGFFGCASIYALRVNLSVAIVCMVNQTAIDIINREKELAQLNNTNGTNSSSVHSTAPGGKCKPPVNSSVEEKETDGPFSWDKDSQGNILSAFFWGYLFTQILGGWLAQRFGGKKILAGNVLVTTVVTFLTPIGAQLDKHILIALRVLMGFAQGSTFPAFHTLWSHWSPPMERSKLTGLTYAGLQAGNVLTMSLSGVLCKYGFGGGWPSVFYVLGISGVIWLGLWLYYASDTPSTHGKITAAERAFIVSSLSDEVGEVEHGDKGAVPWFQIAKSLPVWACFAGHFAGDWGAYLMLTSLPTYLREVLEFKMTSLGLAALPYIAYFFCINAAGVVADFLLSRRILGKVNTRRLMMVIALVGQAVFLVAAGFCQCGQEMIVIALITIGMGLSGFQYAGFIVSYMEIAPRYAGPIVGVGNTLSCFSGIIAPILTSVMTRGKTREEWLSVFYVTGAILVLGATVFCVFIKGEVQPWAVASKRPKPIEMARLAADDGTKKEPEKHDQLHDAKEPLV